MTVSADTLRSISAPDRLDSRLGSLKFTGGFPSPETSELVQDLLDFVHELNAYLSGFPGASTQAMRTGFHEAGVKDNAVLNFSELMGSESLFLTANADGTTTVVFGPERPADTPEGNWIQTDEDKGFFAILRCYSPLESYVDTSWRPSEIEAVSTNP